jgi:hypothetical protein
MPPAVRIAPGAFEFVIVTAPAARIVVAAERALPVEPAAAIATAATTIASGRAAAPARRRAYVERHVRA